MKVGSLIECIAFFSPHITLHAWVIANERPPVPGEQFIVEKIDRCDCGKHDLVGLDNKRLMYDARHFKEVQTIQEANDLLIEIREHQIDRVIHGELLTIKTSEN